MSERAKIPAKTPEAKRKHTISRKQKTTRSQSMNSPADRVLFFQRTLGNQAVQRMMKSNALQAKLRNSASCPVSPRRCPFGGACHTCPVQVQTKLRIGQPNDKYEQEADRVADQVMRMPEPRVQRQVEEEEEEPIQTKLTNGASLQRQEEEPEEKEPVQTKQVGEQTPRVSRDLEVQIHSMRITSQPSPRSVRNFFESRFGYDFSKGRIHNDTKATEFVHVKGSIGKKTIQCASMGPKTILFGRARCMKNLKGLALYSVRHYLKTEFGYKMSELIRKVRLEKDDPDAGEKAFKVEKDYVEGSYIGPRTNPSSQEADVIKAKIYTGKSPGDNPYLAKNQLVIAIDRTIYQQARAPMLPPGWAPTRAQRFNTFVFVYNCSKSSYTFLGTATTGRSIAQLLGMRSTSIKIIRNQ